MAKADGGEMRLADPGQVELLVRRLDEGLRVVVICGCADGARCHRSLVARLVRARRPSVAIAEMGVIGRTGDLPDPRPWVDPVGR